MFDFSWTEIALIGAVALVVIGPKDLPKALRAAGKWARKARTVSREFQSSVEQMIREAELDEVKNEIDKVTAVDLEHEFQKAVDPTGDLAEQLKPPEMPDITKIGSGAPDVPALPPAPESPSMAPPAESPSVAPPTAEPAGGEPRTPPHSGAAP
jgi:sec-independent protein translocase protein TatB